MDTPARRAKSVVDISEAVALDELDGHLFASKIFLTSSSSSRIRCPTRGKRQAAMLRSAQIYRTNLSARLPHVEMLTAADTKLTAAIVAALLSTRSDQ